MSIKRPISLTNLPPFLFQTHEVQDDDAIHRAVHDKEPTANGDVLKGESKNTGPGPSNQKVLNAWQCAVCRMEFKLKERAAARKHFCSHNYTGRKRKGTCLICYGSYSREIVEHMRSHKINLVLKCLLCEKAFSSKGARNRHMKTHKEDMSFQCITCAMTFDDLVTFCRHHDEHSAGDIVECETCHQKYDYICIFFSHPCILCIESKETLPTPP